MLTGRIRIVQENDTDNDRILIQNKTNVKYFILLKGHYSDNNKHT